MENGYRSLAAAIVLQAIKDYRKAAKRYKAEKAKEKSLWEMQEITQFIRSGWFRALTDLDPDAVLERLKEEFEE